MSDKERGSDSAAINPHIDPHEGKKEDYEDTSIKVNEDEKTVPKDSQKPLLNDDEKNPEIAISMQDDDEGDAPPLPSKRLPHIETGEEIRTPSIFLHPFLRMKYDWEHSKNLTEFFTRVVCVIFASVGWIVLVGGIPFMSIVQLIIGSVYVDDCPADDRIPRYLIVSGVFGTFLHCISVCTKYIPKGAKDAFKVHRRRCLCIEAILQIFLFIFFIAGCSWVYSIYEPEYEHTDWDNYCHKGLYLFTFWMFNLTFIVLLIVVAVGICGVAFIAFDNGSPKKDIVQQ